MIYKNLSTKKLLVLLVCSMGFCQNVNAQNPSDIPGTIPLKTLRPAATDLVYNGKPLLPDDAKKLQDSKVDLSTINPDETSVLWKDKPTQDLITPEKSIALNLNQPVEFLEYKSEGVGRFAFTISQKTSAGEVKIYRVRLESIGHNVLLRRNLLRKLGYNIPATMWAPQLKVHFKGNYTKDDFVKELGRNTFLAPEKWVVSNTDSQLTIQDAIVFDGGTDVIYNFARGDMQSETIQNRRLFNSLLVPYNLVGVPESVNVFSWIPGKIFNEQLSLPFEGGLAFTPSYEDARWIARRILKLSRQDFVEIVQHAHYPKEVEAVLIEKIISRRNFLRELLSLKEVSAEIAVNANVPKLAKQDWPGYAQNFAYGDPDSPLSGSELFSFFKSKVTTNLITNVVTEFNTRYIPRTDIGFKVFDHQLDVAAKQFADFIRTGKIEKVPFGFYAFPTFGGNLIASREIVTGSYLGTDNMVQLADVVGFSVDAGFFIGADGLPSQVNFTGAIKAFVTRTYAHLKPIKSIKLALKEDFKNILVPNYKGNIGTKLEKVFSPEYEALDDVKKAEVLKELTAELKESLDVGESIIVTTTLGGLLNASPSMGITERLALVASWTKTQSLLSRLHIFRKDSDTIQIYKDPAHLNSRSFYIGLNAYIPFLGFDFTRKEGRARTDFYSLSLKTDNNPDLEDNLRALSRAFLYSKLDALQTIQKPYVIKHEFLEKATETNFFHWMWKKQRLKDMISVQHPTGYQKNYIRRVVGKRSGKNYEDLAINTLNSLLNEYSEEDIVIQTNNSGDPADSVFGSSVSKMFNFEAEIKKENGQDVIVDPYVSITYRWRNWEIKKNDLLDLMLDINKKFRFEFFNPVEFQSVNKIQLSTIAITANVYEDGIKYLLSYTKDQIDDILRSHGIDSRITMEQGKTTGSRIASQDARRAAAGRGLVKRFEKMKAAYISGNVDQMNLYMSEFVSGAEVLLPARDYYALFGGEQNIFVRTQVLGFRDGDEREDQGLMSHSYGRLGSEKDAGPLKEIQGKIGITESEFFIYWLLNRI